MMKFTRKYTLLLFLLILNFNLKSQSFEGGLMLGVNGSQITGDNMVGFDKGGLLAGPWVDYPFNDFFKLRMELTYTGKGSKKPMLNEDVNRNWDLLRLRYLEVPVIASYNLWFLNEKYDAELGLALARCVDQFLVNTYGGEEYNVTVARKTETSFIIGGTYHFNEKMIFFLRYQSSIYNMGTGKSTPMWQIWGQRHIGLINVVSSFGFRYNLGKN